MLFLFRHARHLSSHRLLSPKYLSHSRALSTMSIVHFTFPTPNGIPASILLEEFKVSLPASIAHTPN